MKSFVNSKMHLARWKNLFSTYYVPVPALIPLSSEYLNNLINVMEPKNICAEIQHQA